MTDESPSEKMKLDEPSNGHHSEGEGDAMNHLVAEEDVETDQEFVVVSHDHDEDGQEEEEEEEEDFDEEEEGEEYMEEDEEEENSGGDHSNAKNIFAVKEITDLIFAGGNFKEGDDLKNTIDFSETCVQQMFGKDILAEDSSAAGSSPSPGDQPHSNGHTDGGEDGAASGTEDAVASGTEDAVASGTEDAPLVSRKPSAGGAKRGRKRKKVTAGRKKGAAGAKRKKAGTEEGGEEHEEFPAEYLLSTGLEDKDVEELKLGFTVLQDIMSQSCSRIFLDEPVLSEVADKIEYDQVIDKPMWFTLAEQNLCKGVYRNLSDLMCDIRLIIENCYKFWKLRDDDVIKKAFELEDCLTKRLVLLPEDVQTRVSWDLPNGNGEENGVEPAINVKNLTVQDIRNKSKLFRLVEAACCLSSEARKLTKEALEADIIDFENNVVFCDGTTIIETVNCMWELADIGHFLCLAHPLLRVPQPTQLEVERMFLLPQSSTTLARLVTSLLVRPVSRFRLQKGPPMPYEVWKGRLSLKVSEWYRVYHAKKRDELEVFESIGIEPMFWNILGPDYNPLESHDYHELHYFQRVWLFKGLCSYVLHNHKSMADLFNTFPPDKARVPPLGSDRQGNAYYFYPDFIDVRLYKQNLPRLPTSVGNYLLLPLHLQLEDLQANKLFLKSNPQTPFNSVHIPPGERELFFPKQKFLPYRRKDNLVVLANSVEGLQILLDEFREERLDESLIQALDEVHRAVKRKETGIDYVTYRARCAMFSEYTDYVKRPDNYEDPDLKYWTYKMTHMPSEEAILPSEGATSPVPPNEEENGDIEGTARRSRREHHTVLKSLNGPTLSDLDFSDSSGDRSEAGSTGFGSEDEWAPQDSKRGGKKKLPQFAKPPLQGADDKIKPASPEPSPPAASEEKEEMELQTPQLTTPVSSPVKMEEAEGTMEDPLNIFSMKRELADEARQDPPQEAPPPRPLIKVKSNQSLVREDLNLNVNLLSQAPPPLLLPPHPPPIPPLDQDPLATRPNVKKEDEDDDIEVLEEKLLRPALGPPPGPGENSIMKIGNMVYRLTGPAPNLPPGAMIRTASGMFVPTMPMGRPPAPGQRPPGPRARGPRTSLDPTQQLIIQNPRTLNPRMRGRPAMNAGAIGRGAYRALGPGVPTSPRGAMSMRGSPRQMSPRGGMQGRGALNITPRKATPPPIPRQLLNRNISVSLVEPKPKPALPKLSGVTITPTKTKPSPAKTLIFNSSPTTSMTKAPSSGVKTQMVDANVQLQWQPDGTTSYVIELANNQTQALTKEQVQFFKNKHNGTMPNVVRIAVPLDIARRVKPPCITL